MDLRVKYKEGVRFVAETRGHRIEIDQPLGGGGQDRGMTPPELLLASLGSCAAYVLYFSLINAWGATRASLVTYVFPIVGLALGIFVLGERVQWNLFAGTALVAGGIVIVNGSQVLNAISARRRAPTVAGR